MHTDRCSILKSVRPTTGCILRQQSDASDVPSTSSASVQGLRVERWMVHLRDKCCKARIELLLRVFQPHFRDILLHGLHVSGSFHPCRHPCRRLADPAAVRTIRTTAKAISRMHTPSNPDCAVSACRTSLTPAKKSGEANCPMDVPILTVAIACPLYITGQTSAVRAMMDGIMMPSPSPTRKIPALRISGKSSNVVADLELLMLYLHYIKCCLLLY